MTLHRRAFIAASGVLTAGTLLRVPAAAAATTTADGATPIAAGPARALMKPYLSRALDVRCLAKAVLDSKSIDDMERDLHWQAYPATTLSYTTDRARTGTRSLRFETLLRNDEYIKQNRLPNGTFQPTGVNFSGTPFTAGAQLNFDAPQDWSPFNRISLWCYLHPTDNPINSLSLQFLCEGAAAGPADPVAVHYIGDLKPGEWNHLTWEISELRRDRVIAFVLFQPLAGVPFAGIDPHLKYDFDQLQLERVEVEPVDGWSVSPHKIAYSHVGYRPGAIKLALCSEFDSKTFTLIDAASNQSVATLPTTTITNRRGRFQLLDFTAHTTPGRYRLECGASKGETFEIGENVWLQFVDQVLNGIYGLRCGCEIPGVHSACHLDVFVRYQGERRVVGGGWHDAANLTQGAGRTFLTTYSLLRLYEQLNANSTEKARAARALEEAKWGLDWTLRMRFAPGLRCLQGTYSYWTDAQVGSDDDVVQENVGRDTYANVLGSLAAATAARVLRSIDPASSARALKAAQEDYADVLTQITEPPRVTPPGIAINQGSWRDHIGYLTLAAVELYRVTKRASYRNDANKFGRWLLDIQERRFLDGSPVTGYFYEDAARTRLVHEFHNGNEECGLLALQALCETLPDDPDWMRWYAGVLCYSEYFCHAGAAASAPFDVIPSAVWRRMDLDLPMFEDRLGAILAAHPSPLFPTPPTPQSDRVQMQAMFEAGTRLSETTRLRVFPLWHNHIQHGASTVQLAKSAGFAAATQLRGRRELAELAARQMQWLLGANPFSRSLVYGVGYDFWQNFVGALPNIVGTMSLGFNSYRDDSPAWGNNAVFPYKEMWIFSSCRWVINLAQTAMPSRISGHAAAVTLLREKRTQQTLRLSGRFDRHLPAGRYTASSNGMTWDLDLMEGRHHRLSFDPQHALSLQLASSTDANGGVQLTATLRGSGKHNIGLRLFNCTTEQLQKQVVLQTGVDTRLEWSLQVTDKLQPWIVVAVPNADLEQRQESFGRIGEFGEIA